MYRSGVRKRGECGKRKSPSSVSKAALEPSSDKNKSLSSLIEEARSSNSSACVVIKNNKKTLEMIKDCSSKSESHLLDEVLRDEEDDTEATTSEDEDYESLNSLEVKTQQDLHRTVRVTTPIVLDLHKCQKIEPLHKYIAKEDYEKIVLSYFYFVAFNNSESAMEYKRDLDEQIFESEFYCAPCAFLSRDVDRDDHIPQCRSGDNRELNKMTKISIHTYPSFIDKPEKTVLVVRRFKPVLLDELNELFSETVKIKYQISNVTFPNYFYIKFVDADKNKVNYAVKHLNKNSQHPLVAELPQHEQKPLEAANITMSSGFKNYVMSPSSSAGHLSRNQTFEHKRILAKTLCTGEIDVKSDELHQTILILGNAVKTVNKGKSKRYINWVKKILGPGCCKVNGGVVDHSGTDNRKNYPSNDYSNYVIAYFKSKNEMIEAFKV